MLAHSRYTAAVVALASGVCRPLWSGSCSPPSSSIGADPWRVVAGSRFGEADRMRRDRRERLRRGGRELDNVAPRKTAPCSSGMCDVSRVSGGPAVGPGVRRPGLTRQRPSAGAGPRRAQRAALILSTAEFGNIAAWVTDADALVPSRGWPVSPVSRLLDGVEPAWAGPAPRVGQGGLHVRVEEFRGFAPLLTIEHLDEISK